MHTINGHLTTNRLEAPAPPPASPSAASSETATGGDLLKEIVATSLGPLSRLSETVNLTLDQVSEWIARPENRRNIFNLIGLLDAQTQLLIAQQRVGAAAQLSRLAHDENAGPETVRRACKDLLNMRLIERSRPPRRDARGGDDLAPLPLPAPPAPPMTHADILRDLRRFEGTIDASDSGQNVRTR